jgi:hypothetical protein
MKKLRWIAAAGFAAVLFGNDVPSDAKRWWSHILYLADDKLEGRNTAAKATGKPQLTWQASSSERASGRREIPAISNR